MGDLRFFPHGGIDLLRLSVVLFTCVSYSDAQAENDTYEFEKLNCTKGLIIPLWEPLINLSTGDKIARAIVYFLAMIWLFIGVSIVSDRFMGAIEMITSQEKEVKVKKPNGDTQIIVVQVWNATVANLTLMALGSSAPEILLSVIEMFAKKFEAGDLGPGTIVGSAAFNLFVIIGICVEVIPDGEVRYIKHLRVFFITAFFSIFAYVWLYVILAQISVGKVEFWEAFLTLLFFPITVLWAYVADRKLLVYKYLTKEYRMSSRGVIVEVEGADIELGSEPKDEPVYDENVDESVKEFEEHRKEFMAVIRELRQKYPDISMETLESMAREEIINRGPKSRAFYRIKATRKLTGGGNIMKKVRDETKHEQRLDELEEKKEDDTIRIYFDPGHYTVMESVGSFEVSVVREGGDVNATVLVDYKTEDGTANADADYIPVEGTLVFLPQETIKTFSIEVIDDDVFEEDEHFYVRLSNMRFGAPDGTTVTHAVNGSAGQQNKQSKLELAAPFVATIMILDDDHGGIFNVDEKDVEIVESIGTYELKIVRISGARGRVKISYNTEDGTAKAGKDYEECKGDLIFENNETEQFVPIQVLEEDSYEKDVLFYLNIEEPEAQGDDYKGFEFETKEKDDLTEEEKIALLGKPKLGENIRCQIRIKENKEYKNMVDKLVKKANASLVVGTSSWKEQFVEALSVNADEDEEGGEGEEGEEGEEKEEKLPSCGDYVMHFVTVVWKVLFAFIPPTDLHFGYPTFFISIMFIGILTAVIGDFASQLGCTVGLKDTINAIAFVALGTSVPDLLNGYPTFVMSIVGVAILTAIIGDVAAHVGCTIGLKDTINAILFVALGTSVPDNYKGWPCFFVSIALIGFLTAFIGDVASHFGCTIGLKDSVTAVSIVALGTSVPDTLASKVAAQQDPYADNSVGNVTGSNGVNVFLGIGIAWTMATIYHNSQGRDFNVEPGNLAFSVTLFCVEAFVAISIMLIRRHPKIGGELGGPEPWKKITSYFFIFLWFFYIFLSTLEAYKFIEGF